MAEILKGKPVTDAINNQIAEDVSNLKGNGITPTLAILRVGERADDLSYERGAMLLMHENATVTICHTKTQDVASITREADIVVVASGQMEFIGEEYLREGQIVIDEGISYNDVKGKLCGDVKYDEVCDLVAGITPVPGGAVSLKTVAILGKNPLN